MQNNSNLAIQNAMRKIGFDLFDKIVTDPTDYILQIPI